MSLVSSRDWLWTCHITKVGPALLFLCPPSPQCYDNRCGPLCLAGLSVFFLASEFSELCIHFGQQSFTCCALQRFRHNLQLFNAVFKNYTYLCVSTAWCACAIALVWRAEDKLWRLAPSFHHVVSGTRLGSSLAVKCLYSMNHLTGLLILLIPDSHTIPSPSKSTASGMLYQGFVCQICPISLWLPLASELSLEMDLSTQIRDAFC